MALLSITSGAVEMQTRWSQTCIQEEHRHKSVVYYVIMLHFHFGDNFSCSFFIETLFAFLTLSRKRITKLSTVGPVYALLPSLVSNALGPSLH